MASSGRAYSYIRFSTPGQSFGDSLRRQLERTAAYCAAQNPPLILDESLKDEGLSGYHGAHRKRGALGRFLARVKAGEIERGSVLIVEAFDRMSRQTPREAQEQFLSLINAGIEVVTLIDGQRFSAASVDANAGQLFLSIGMMMGAHQESANKADRVRESWKKRRQSSTNVVPSWITRTEGELVINEVKAAIVRRIFADIQVVGLDRLAKRLNSEGIPVLSARHRERGRPAWDKGSLSPLIRGRQVLGEQEIGHYVGNRRQRTGKYVSAYPAIVTEAEWYAANATLDARKRGVANGRNVTRVTNMFGDLARCATCGGRMKIKQKGRVGQFYYLGCSNAGVGTCEATKYHRLDKIETEVLDIFGSLAYNDRPAQDQTEALLAEIITAKEKADRFAKRYETAFDQFGDDPDPLALANLDRISSQHKAALADVFDLERKLATTKTATPPSDHLAIVKGFLAGLDGLHGEERVAARARIAAALPQFVRRLVFKQDGWSVELIDGWTFKNGSGWRASGVSTLGVSLWHPERDARRDGLPRIIGLPVPANILSAAKKQSARALAAFQADETARKRRKPASNGHERAAEPPHAQRRHARSVTP